MVSSLVSSARTTSSSFIRWTGLKKCIPTTCLGRWVAAAISVIESDEVLEARIACGPACRSTVEKISTLRSISSGTASITRSASRVASSSRRTPETRR